MCHVPYLFSAVGILCLAPIDACQSRTDYNHDVIDDDIGNNHVAFQLDFSVSNSFKMTIQQWSVSPNWLTLYTYILSQCKAYVPMLLFTVFLSCHWLVSPCPIECVHGFCCLIHSSDIYMFRDINTNMESQVQPFCNCCCSTRFSSGSNFGTVTSLPSSMEWRLLCSLPQHFNFMKTDLQDSIKTWIGLVISIELKK